MQPTLNFYLPTTYHSANITDTFGKCLAVSWKVKHLPGHVEKWTESINRRVQLGCQRQDQLTKICNISSNKITTLRKHNK